MSILTAVRFFTKREDVNWRSLTALSWVSRRMHAGDNN